MKHPLPGEVVEPDDKPHCLLPSHVDDVLPARERFRLPVALENLELEAVHVERVIHADEVFDFPDFGGAQFRREVDARKVEVAVVDHALAEGHDSSRGDASRIEGSDLA